MGLGRHFTVVDIVARDRDGAGGREGALILQNTTEVEAEEAPELEAGRLRDGSEWMQRDIALEEVLSNRRCGDIWLALRSQAGSLTWLLYRLSACLP